MKIILLKDIPGLGIKYDIKNVNDGYARNYLLPQKMAEIATDTAVKNLMLRKKKEEEERAIQKNILEKNIKLLEGKKIELIKKANEKGHLFDAVDRKELEKILEQNHIHIPANLIEIEKPIKELGEYKIKIQDSEFILKISSQ